MKLLDDQTPGIVAFFGRIEQLAGRVGSAFIRGVVYQWILENQDEPDFEERLSAVLDGPGGRVTMGFGVGHTAAPIRKLGQAAGTNKRPRREPRPQGEQPVMPVGDAPRSEVREQEARLVMAIEPSIPQAAPHTPAAIAVTPATAAAPAPAVVAGSAVAAAPAVAEIGSEDLDGFLSTFGQFAN